MALPEHTRAWLERAEAAFAAAVVALALIGVGLLPLTTPPAVRGLVAAVGSERDTGLSREETVEAAEDVRRFVTDADAPALPERVAGRPGFDAFAVAHLVDVRDVLVPARTLTLALAIAVLVWGLARGRAPRGRRVVGAACAGAGGLLLGVAGLVMVAGAFDFDRLFTQFHGLFFEAGTWVFPNDALLIQVFPLRFWIAAGAVWGGAVLLLAVAVLVAGRRLGFTRSRLRV
jgi:hypothetical protein